MKLQAGNVYVKAAYKIQHYFVAYFLLGSQLKLTESKRATAVVFLQMEFVTVRSCLYYSYLIFLICMLTSWQHQCKI